MTWKRVFLPIIASAFLCFYIGIASPIVSTGKLNIVADPAIEVVVNQENGKVTFAFFYGKETLKGLVRTPYECSSLVVGSSDRKVIWSIYRPTIGPGESQIEYGVVPKGFTQQTPESGFPPRLEVAKEYVVFANSGGGGKASFVYAGNR
jgi:hypothetical protein